MALDLIREGYGADHLYTAISEVVCERHKQDSKWGEQNHSSEVWLAVLAEEFGEVAEAILDLRSRKWERQAKRADHLGIERPDEDEYRQLLRYELVQVAAVAVAWVEYIDRHAGQRITGEAS